MYPKNMRRKIRKMVHAAHSGIEACLKLAREYFYWPGITAQVKEHVEACEACAATGPSLPKETWAAEDNRPFTTKGDTGCGGHTDQAVANRGSGPV